jgi:hypothetical protein
MGLDKVHCQTFYLFLSIAYNSGDMSTIMSTLLPIAHINDDMSTVIGKLSGQICLGAYHGICSMIEKLNISAIFYVWQT